MAPGRMRFVLSALALLGTLLGAPARSSGEDIPTPRVRQAVKGWGFSVLMFEDWPAVPLRPDAASAAGDELLDSLRVLRFFERGEADRYVSFKEAAVSEAYASGRKPGDPAPQGAATTADMRKVLVLAAEKYGFGAFTLDPAAAKRVTTKDGVKGSMWRVEVGYYSGLFGVWEKDGMQVGLWIGGRWINDRKYELGFNRVLHSVLWKDGQSRKDPLDVLGEVNLPPERRSALERGMVRGWDVERSPRRQYVVVYNTKGGRNAKLARLIAERIEQIRAQVYEKDFPPLRPFDDVAIVRVCGDALEYGYYGGPIGSAGYWNEKSQELVFYDVSPKRAVDEDTLCALYHEAFHQYIYYALGRLAPHPWFNEGHGDYYAGARFGKGAVEIAPFGWRVHTIRAAIGRGTIATEPQGGYVPLETFVGLDQRQYYSYPTICYAEGWSLVYFLRKLVPGKPEWNAKWGQILERYFRTLQAELAKASSTPEQDPPKPDGEPGAPAGPQGQPPGPPSPPADAADPGVPVVLRDSATDRRALATALEAAFEGVSFDELTAAWLQEMGPKPRK